ncbi:MAG: hypothetical protein QOG20_3233 [Pseudonocardiales bacterium]|jgi:hypothetical protein|nr:hypothetical protein [Pseudonocardiales bacterium]
MGWVGILMFVSAAGWHRGRMTTTGETSDARSLSHALIVIGTSSGFSLLGGVDGVSSTAVMSVPHAAARAARLALDGARNRARAATGTLDGRPTDLGCSA